MSRPKYRWEKALEFYPNIKQSGLQVSDYNCTWYVSADKVEQELEALRREWDELKQTLEAVQKAKQVGDEYLFELWKSTEKERGSALAAIAHLREAAKSGNKEDLEHALSATSGFDK